MNGKKPMAEPVDLSRFRELSDNDAEGFRELIDLYTSKTTEQMADLERAVTDRRAAETARIAHSLVGANLMVGMNGVVPLLRKLESSGENNDFTQASALVAEIAGRFETILKALQQARPAD